MDDRQLNKFINARILEIEAHLDELKRNLRTLHQLENETPLSSSWGGGSVYRTGTSRPTEDAALRRVTAGVHRAKHALARKLDETAQQASSAAGMLRMLLKALRGTL